MPKKALITGITGQDGSYLAEFLLKKGYQVHGLVRRVALENPDHRLLRINHLPRNKNFRLHAASLENYPSICQILTKVKPDEIYHLAAQSFVSYSFEDEHSTMQTNITGTHFLLSAVSQIVPKAKFYFAASSEMFGNAPETPQNEKTPFNPRSPYGVSKVAGYHLTRYQRNHPGIGLFAVNGILFNHECVTSETPVLTESNGLIDIARIDEVVPHRTSPRHGIKYSTLFKNGLRVWDGTGWTKIKTATATWNKAGTAADKKVKRVICRGGYYEATQDHLSFLQNGKSINTGNLKRGDKLKLLSLPQLNPKVSVTPEEAEFLGMIVADGYISEDGKGRFINNDMGLRSKAAALWQKVAGGQSRETTHPSGFNAKKEVRSLEFSGSGSYLRFIWNQIYDQKLFKKVPRRILNADINIVKIFLKGYNSCDGLKGGRQKTEFKSFTTNSPSLALGLWYLINGALGLRITMHPEFRENKLYFHLNINSDKKTSKGKHLQKEISEVKDIQNYRYSGWLFDLETESGTFSAGVGLNWIHNSPRRGMEFVTRKITHTAALIKHGLADKLYLGNPDARRDWGHAGDYVEAMWLMMQKPKPDDYVIATGETHSVREFAEAAFAVAGLDPKKHVVYNNPGDMRPSEVHLLIGDARKARKVLGWKPKVKFKDLVRLMVESDLKLVEKQKQGLSSQSKTA